MKERTGEDVIRERRESRQLVETFIKTKGAELYETFDDNERTCVQFGMFPAGKMETATAALLQDLVDAGDAEFLSAGDASRLLAVAVMDAANAGTQKMVV